MKAFTLMFVLAVLLAQIIGSFAQSVTDPPTDPTTTTAKTTTSATTTTSTTTTSAPETTTTTTTPRTTPAPAPVPTPTPTPSKPFPGNEGKWSVGNENSSCILLKGALELIFFYESENKKENHTVKLDVPDSAKANGTCNKNQVMVLSWDLNTLTLMFESNETKMVGSLTNGVDVGNFALQNISVSVFNNKTLFLDYPSNETLLNFTISNKGAFQTPLNRSYACLAQEEVKADDGSLAVKFSDIRLEAYKTAVAGHNEFSAAIECAADDASDIVPIAVGAALAGLVVIVLIAYLIGRRRSRARGYQSV